jgi:hypothetical protein
MTETREFQTGLELNSITSEFSGVLGNVAYSTISGTRVKSGAYSLRNTGSDLNQGKAVSRLATLPSGTLQIGIGLHIFLEVGDAGSKYPFVHWADEDINSLGDLRYDSTSQSLLLYVNNSLQGSYSPVVINQFYHIGIDIKQNTSGWLNVYLDGAEVISYSNTGTVHIKTVLFGTYPYRSGFPASSIYMDDLTINNRAGEASSNPMNDLRYELLVPDATGTYSQWMGSDGNQIDNYLLVDEIPPSSADYVSATGTLYKDSYALEDYTLPQNATIEAIIPLAIAQKGDISDIRIALGNRLNSDEVISTGTAHALPTSYGMLVFDRFETTPLGDPWGEADVDNVQVLQSSYGSFE